MQNKNTVEILQKLISNGKYNESALSFENFEVVALQEAIKAIAERDDNWQLYLQETKKHEEYFNKYKELLSRVTVKGIANILSGKTIINEGILATAIYNFIRGEK